MDNLFVVETIEIGKAWLPDGRQYDVVAMRHNRCWTGTDSPITFAVYEHGIREEFRGIISAVGFLKEEECYDYLTAHGAREYYGRDNDGSVIRNVRQGLGIPHAYVVRHS